MNVRGRGVTKWLARHMSQHLKHIFDLDLQRVTQVNAITQESRITVNRRNEEDLV